MKQPGRKRALITGASGFIGSWLADAARETGLELFGIDLQTPSKPQIWADFITGACENVDFDRVFGEQHIDLVFHLAGGASVPASVRDPFSDFSSLLPGTARLVAHLIKRGSRPHLIFFSSAAVYGNPEKLPISEDHPLKPISPYGIHKATAEAMLQQYARAYELPVSIMRIFSAYGPGLRKQILWDVGQRALQAVANKEKTIALHGTGSETRDFIYVSDLADAALLVASKPPKSGLQILNVSSGSETSIAEVSEHLIASLGLNIEVNFNGNTRSGDPCNWHADTGRLCNLGFQKKINTSVGILRVAEWMKGFLRQAVT